MNQRGVGLAAMFFAALGAVPHADGQNGLAPSGPATRQPAPEQGPMAPAPAKPGPDRAVQIRAQAEKLARSIAEKDEALYNEILANLLLDYGGAKGSPRPPVPPRLAETGAPPLAEPGLRVKPVAPARGHSPIQRESIQRVLLQHPNIKKLLREGASAAPDAATRIFGGRPAKVNEFPHCVALLPDFNAQRNCCTGTLVGPNTVLTAAHCRDCFPLARANEYVAVVYFGLDANNRDPAKVKRGRYIPHHDFNPHTFENDIAMIVLDEPVLDVRPCRIAVTAEIDGAQHLTLAGFGVTENQVKGVQYTVDVGILDNSCRVGQAAGGIACNVGKEMVAGNPGKDTCFGDSGGPAYVQGAELLLAGITSRGPADCGQLGIYTRADAHRDWISRTATANGGILGPQGTAVGTAPATQPNCPMDYSSRILNAIEEWRKIRPDLMPP